MGLDDLAVSIYVALMPALDGQPISDRCFHGSPSPRRYVPGLSLPSPAAEIRVPGRSGPSGIAVTMRAAEADLGPLLAGSLILGTASCITRRSALHEPPPVLAYA